MWKAILLLAAALFRLVAPPATMLRTSLSSLARRAATVRQKSAAVATFDDGPAVDETFVGGYPAGDVQTTKLDNGVTVVSTCAAPVATIGAKLGVGAASGPASAAFAASKMAFKSANGATDLKIQRDLELLGSTPQADVSAGGLVVAVEALKGDGAEAAFKSVATGLGVGRDAYVAWEFDEMKASPGVLASLEALATDGALAAAAREAAGAGGKVACAESLAALSSSDVDAFLQDALAAAPLTVVAMGVDHATAKHLAAAAFGDLPARGAAAAPPAFEAGMATVSSGASAVALAVPAPADAAVAAALAATCGGTLDAGLLVVAGADKAAAAAKLDGLSAADAGAAKAAAKFDVLSKTGMDLFLLLADGVDPAKLAGSIDAVSDAAFAKAAKAAGAAGAAMAVSV